MFTSTRPRLKRSILGVLFASVVAAGGLASQASAQTVSLTDNNSHGSSSTLYVGDSWTINLTGTPYAEIYINGTDTGSAILSNGTQSFSGSIPEGSEGYNQQYWTVGTSNASPYPLSFTVLADPGGTCGDAVNWNVPASTITSTDSIDADPPDDSVSTETDPSTDSITVSLNSSPTTYCNVESAEADLTGDPAVQFLYASYYPSGTTVYFSAGDSGCQPDPDEERTCYPAERDNFYEDYPFAQYMVLRVFYYDQYYQDLYEADQDIDLWVTCTNYEYCPG